jgi:glycosyltransferase involved in cell wall biosynthesis
LNQDWPGTEIIVVDDGSTDDTVERIRPYLPKVKYLRQHNAGPAVARNCGIEAATGQYLAFLDADDEWLPGKLMRQISDLERDDSINLSSTGAFVVDVTNTVFDIISTPCRGDIFRTMLRYNPVVCSSVVLRRRELLAAGLRFEGAPSSMEDYLLWLKLAARWRFNVSPRIFVRYHLTPTNKTSARSIEVHRRDLSQVFEDAQRDRVFSRRLAGDGLRIDTSIRLSVAREQTERGQSKQARAELVTAVTADWRAATCGSFWRTLLWSGRARTAVRALRRHIAVRLPLADRADALNSKVRWHV